MPKPMRTSYAFQWTKVLSSLKEDTRVQVQVKLTLLQEYDRDQAQEACCHPSIKLQFLQGQPAS
jgi:hypothetical protein